VNEVGVRGGAAEFGLEREASVLVAALVERFANGSEGVLEA